MVHAVSEDLHNTAITRISQSLLLVETSRDHGDGNDRAHVLIDLGAENDIRFVISHLVDRLGCGVHFLKRHVACAGDREDYPRRLRRHAGE